MNLSWCSSDWSGASSPFFFFFWQVNLANWEKNRENERRSLLIREAESKQQGDVWTSVNKHRNTLLERWMFR